MYASSFSRNSVAFTQNDNAAVLYRSNTNGQLTLSEQNGGTWHSSAVTTTQPTYSYALAYDSYNQANVVYSNGPGFVYASRGVLTGNNWAATPVQSSQQQFIPPVQGPMDLALTSTDIPYVIYNSEMNLHCLTYDRIQNQWADSILGTSLESNYCMAADYQGGIGIAYVTRSFTGAPTIGFAYMNDDQSWTMQSIFQSALYPQGSQEIPSILPYASIGLTFDAQNNPVISFSAEDRTWIAYDPVSIPEPATMVLLLAGGIMALRKHQRA
jgi:hypothetical protein